MKNKGKRYAKENNRELNIPQSQDKSEVQDSIYSADAEDLYTDADFSQFDSSDVEKTPRVHMHNDEDATRIMTRSDRKKKIKSDRKKQQKADRKIEKAAQKKAEKTSRAAVENSRRSANRQALSYEDLPLDESTTKPKRRFGSVNKKGIVLSCIILAVLVLSVTIFVNADRLTYENIVNWVKYGIFNEDKDQRFPVSISGDSISSGNFKAMGNYLAYSSDTSFVTLNNYGKTIYSTQLSFSDPVLVTSNDFSLVYNLGGTGFQINSSDNNIYTAVADNNILVADIADNGYYALVTQYDGYLSKLFVYDDNNKQIFAYSFADYYITSVSLNSSGTQAVLGGVSAYNGSEICAVYMLDFTQEEPTVFKEFENNLIYSVKYLTDKYVAVIGSNACYCLNARSQEFETTSYDSKNLTAYDINTSTDTFCISLSRSGDGRLCDILCFSTNGKLSKTISTDCKVTSMDTYKNRIALLSDETVYLYSKDGNVISQTNAGIKPHAVVLHSTSGAYILGVGDISDLEL